MSTTFLPFHFLTNVPIIYFHIKVMVDHLISMRITLRQTLEELNSSSSWEHITKQVTILKSLHNRILNAAANCQNFRLECFTSLVYPLRKLTNCRGISIYTWLTMGASGTYNSLRFLQFQYWYLYTRCWWHYDNKGDINNNMRIMNLLVFPSFVQQARVEGIFSVACISPRIPQFHFSKNTSC